MGNLLSKPKKPSYDRNWREAMTNWWEFRAIYGNISERALAYRIVSELNVETDTTPERISERMRQNGLG